MTFAVSSRVFVPTPRRVLVLGTGHSSTAFVRSLDPKLLSQNGGRIELVVASPKDTCPSAKGEEDIRSVVMKNGEYVQGHAKKIDLNKNSVLFSSIVRPSTEFEIAYDSVVIGVGDSTTSVRGGERFCFKLAEQRNALVAHLSECIELHEFMGDETFLTVAIVANRGAEKRAKEVEKDLEVLIANEFPGSGIKIVEKIVGAIRVHENFVVETLKEDGSKNFRRFGTCLLAGERPSPRSLVVDVKSQLGLVDSRASGRNGGIVVDGYMRAVGGPGNVYAVGSAAFEHPDPRSPVRERDDVSIAQGAYLASIFNKKIVRF